MTCVEICARAVMCTGNGTHCGTVVRSLLHRGCVCYFNSDLRDDSDCSRMSWKQFSLRFSWFHRDLKYTWLPATRARSMLEKFRVGGRDRKLFAPTDIRFAFISSMQLKVLAINSWVNGTENRNNVKQEKGETKSLVKSSLKSH